MDETGIYKNLLQETAHRAGSKLPLYTAIRSGSGHAPVFSCTVELAGMSFSGKRSRTKKQAQKNAAMAAWIALKQLAQSRSSPSASTSSSSPQVVGSDEQDQVIIARVLASLQLSESNSSSAQFDQQRSFSTNNIQNPPQLPSPSYSVQHGSWGYSSFPAEITMYQVWQQQTQRLQLQTRIFPLPMSLNPPVQSVFQEPVPTRPGLTMPTLSHTSYLPRGIVLSPIRGTSTVKIQEIEETTDRSLNLRLDENRTVVQEHAQNRQTQKYMDSNRLNRIRPQRPQMPNSHMIGISTSTDNLVLRPGLLALPRNQNLGNQAPAQLQIRTRASANLGGQGTGFGRVPSRVMVPAVQIRTVAPVCSAPLSVRKKQSSCQVGQSSNQKA